MVNKTKRARHITAEPQEDEKQKVATVPILHHLEFHRPGVQQSGVGRNVCRVALDAMPISVFGRIVRVFLVVPDPFSEPVGPIVVAEMPELRGFDCFGRAV